MTKSLGQWMFLFCVKAFMFLSYYGAHNTAVLQKKSVEGAETFIFLF